jgi:hypothetical protein
MLRVRGSPQQGQQENANRDGAIQAQKLDLGSYTLTGDVVRIFDNVR